MVKGKRVLYFTLLIAFVAICYFPVFYKLDVNSIKVWDEARYANNAIEMLETGNILVVKFNGKPDYWNAKPPLMVWAQAITMKCIGINVLAVRLPSALAAVLTIILLILFSTRILKIPIIGYLAALALITSKGYIAYHVTRTGDVDSMLTFLTTLYALSFFAFLLKYPESKTKYLVLFTLALVLASYTKGVAGIIPLTGIFVYFFTQKASIKILTNYQIYLAILAFITLYLGYYLVREHFDPGYIKAVLSNELGFYKNNFHKQEPFLYYINNLINYKFKTYILYALLGIIIGLLQKNKLIRKFTLFATCYVVFFLLVHSLSTNKNYWYDAPAFPFLCLLVAIFIYFVTTEFLFNYLAKKETIKNLVWLIVLLSFFYKPYSNIIDSIKPDKTAYQPEKESTFINKLNKKSPEINAFVVDKHKDEWVDPVLFYMRANKDKQITFRNNSGFFEGELLLSCNQSTIDSIKSKCDYEIVSDMEDCVLIRISRIKSLNE